jgi:ATP-binding cassette subfamily C protein CydD
VGRAAEVGQGQPAAGGSVPAIGPVASAGRGGRAVRPHMRPFDPRLIRYARGAHALLGLTVLLGVAATVLIIVQAGLIAAALAGAAHGIGRDVLSSTLAALLVVVSARAALAYASEAAALRAAATVKSQLRRRLTACALRLGPAWLSRQQPGEITTLATQGLDSLDNYFSRYLPQVVLACLVPVAVLARIAVADWISAVVIGVTLPLVPVFAVLVGLHTKARTERQWQLLARLGGHFLDVVEGLPTLKIFGQSGRQADVIARVTEEHRRTAMSTLRQAFLSALVLDLAATLATALVAVEVGLRLLGGHIGYQEAMLILLLTPEVYLPLRAVGTFYHASMEGAAAGGRAFEILCTRPAGVATASGGTSAPADLRRQDISLAGVTVEYPGRGHPALDQISLRISPGEKILVAGPSGAGKSTLLAVLLRFTEPQSGRIEVGGTDLGTLGLQCWRDQIAWVPQHPALFAGSVRDNIALGNPEADANAVAAAAELAGAGSFIAELPAGYDTVLGERGLQLSAGQRQRLALARAFLRDAPLLLLDEPTAHLDAGSAAELRATVTGRMADRTVIVVSHDDSWADSTGLHITLRDGRIVTSRQAGRRPAVEPGDAELTASPAVTAMVQQ